MFFASTQKNLQPHNCCFAYETAVAVETITVRDVFVGGEALQAPGHLLPHSDMRPRKSPLPASVTHCLLSGRKPPYFGVSFSHIAWKFHGNFLTHSLLPHIPPTFPPLPYLSHFKLRDLYKLSKLSVLELYPHPCFVTLAIWFKKYSG